MMGVSVLVTDSFHALGDWTDVRRRVISTLRSDPFSVQGASVQPEVNHGERDHGSPELWPPSNGRFL